MDVGRGGQGLSRNAFSVSFGHAEHCFLTVWTPMGGGGGGVQERVSYNSIVFQENER